MKTPKKEKNVLIFSAHPDDHLACAGSLMLLKNQGFKIKEVVATAGENGPWWTKEKKQKINFEKAALKDQRFKEISQAAKLIGITQTIFLHLIDGAVVRDFTAIEKIIAIIRKEKPAIVFLPNQNDYHCDHREFSKIVLEAIEKASWDYLYEKGKPWRVPVVLMWEGFYLARPDIIIDISPFLEKKKKLIKIYRSQINAKEEKLIDAFNTYRVFGLRKEKCSGAEAFEIPLNFPLEINWFFN